MGRTRKPGTVCPGPVLPGHQIQYDDEQLVWVIDQTLLPCSEPAYQCLKVLLEHANRCVPFEQLQRCLQEQPLPSTDGQKRARMRVAHLISNLRPKIWAVGLDVVSVMDVGYILLAGSEGSSASLSEENA